MSVLAGAHRFLPKAGEETFCHVCDKHMTALIHGCSEHPTDLMPRAEEFAFVYVDAGSVDLTISKGHTREALEKLHLFVGNLLAR